MGDDRAAVIVHQVGDKQTCDGLPPWQATSAPPAPKARERFCWYCGKSLGIIEDRLYDRTDTCGASECERELRYAHQAERDEAHERLDRDMGWDW